MRKILSNLKKKYLHYKRSKYFNKISNLIKDNPSIISNNCFAGRIYQDFDMPYNSPTAGLYIFYPDYIEFLSDLANNLKKELNFVSKSKYELGNQRLKEAKHPYPVALLDNRIEIHFLHYKDEDEAKTKWYRRASRVNTNNLVVLGGEMDLCTPRDIEAFDKLKFPIKFFFSAKKYNYKSCLHVKEFESRGIVGDSYQYGDIFYKYLSEKLNNGSN